jgi:hypothetical protein
VPADGGDEGLVVQPDQVGAALKRGVGGLEPERRDPAAFLQGLGVEELEMLARIAQEAHRGGGIEGAGMAGGDPIVVFDLPGELFRGGVVEEEAHSGHALEAVCAIPVERDVEGVRITPHLASRLNKPAETLADSLRVPQQDLLVKLRFSVGIRFLGRPPLARTQGGAPDRRLSRSWRKKARRRERRQASLA